jgi:hypothetical protein
VRAAGRAGMAERHEGSRRVPWEIEEECRESFTAVGCSTPKIQILNFSQTRSKFKMNFKFHFKMFVYELISTNKI